MKNFDERWLAVIAGFLAAGFASIFSPNTAMVIAGCVGLVAFMILTADSN